MTPAIMFMLKAIVDNLLGGKNEVESETDLITIANGEFYMYQSATGRKNEVGLSRNLIFKQASISIRKLSTPFQYKLIISSLLEEEDGDEDINNELEFIVNRLLDVKIKLYNDRFVIFWTENNSDSTLCEFAIASGKVTKVTIDMFRLILSQSMYETEHRQPYSNASDEELECFVSVASDENDSSFSAAVASSCKLSDETISKFVFTLKHGGCFYVYDPSTAVFIPAISSEAEPLVSVSFYKFTSTTNFHYIMFIYNANSKEIHHQQTIDTSATTHLDLNSNSFIWCFKEDAKMFTFSLKFIGSDLSQALNSFATTYAKFCYEILNQSNFSSSVSKDDEAFLVDQFLNSNNDVKMTDAFDEDSDDSNSASASTDDDNDSLDNENESVEEREGKFNNFKSSTSKDYHNSQLAIGYCNNRTFVSRGSSIGVFKYDDSTEGDATKLSFHANIESAAKTKIGKVFIPSKMMLHEQDSSLILMNPDNKNNLYKMDLEVGKIVEEWNVHPDAPVLNIIPDSKYAQMTPSKTFIGINSNSLFRIDPRLNTPSKRVENEMKEYAVKNEFNCGATTGKGELAVASNKGDIRLYNKIDKRAKTLLPGFGDAILGIDVSESGRWIVATCKTYLLLIDTQDTSSSSASSSSLVTGFTKSLGSKKPTPKRLQLRPEHIAYMNEEVSFTPARFSTGDSEERTIITSTSCYVIVWNLKKIKAGKLYDYQMKKYADKIVADNFRYNADSSIVIALRDNVTSVEKKQLKTSTPKSICYSSAFDAKRSIVDSPF